MWRMRPAALLRGSPDSWGRYQHNQALRARRVSEPPIVRRPRRPASALREAQACRRRQHQSHTLRAGDVNTNRTLCVHDGCQKCPRFGVPGSEPLYCTEHKRADDVDTRYTLCARNRCQKLPSFSAPGARPLYCAEHKRAGDINTRYSRVKRKAVSPPDETPHEAKRARLE